MTLKQYEQKLEKVKANWHKMPHWVRQWTRLLLADDLKKIE